ncbi:hypothetical protein A5722_03510 [Mycobacterium vulneris]|nr:hypothetical protein A5722_03510 [Mycolicibacterium vulneris]OCB63383.1 hypothetical protein A5729_24905 [Mycolicibacterium vulneris]
MHNERLLATHWVTAFRAIGEPATIVIIDDSDHLDWLAYDDWPPACSDAIVGTFRHNAIWSDVKPAAPLDSPPHHFGYRECPHSISVT